MTQGVVEGEVSDVFDAFIDPKYVSEPQNQDISNADLFRLYFGNELSGQLPPSSQITPSVTNLKTESTDIDMLLGNLLGSEPASQFGVADSTLLYGPPNLMHSVQPPTVSPTPVVNPKNTTTTTTIAPSSPTAAPLPIAPSPPKSTHRTSSAELEAELDPANPNFQNLSSKERRQLRNKISARNFRVRRKEYISTLEQQVQQYQNEIKSIRDSMSRMEDENKRLRLELEAMRNKSDAHVPNNDADSPVAMEIEVKEEKSTNPSFKLKSGVSSLSSTEPFNKDVPNSTASCASPRWQDSRVIVR
ncbi:hypothetical protein K493DRAFT_311865 [Basidiobolus meristosporus CBS 931.73]|uniref:BZIP domain-containing protein n=1 Tax=Basidiobolus meristosporus CBS 931.73 TaxID=1314790 RepID=A0A1Y1YZ63_9FUNG|nr:hypothetical protein K493DRAFT_311865 [Basidiobolus meristosporus CBS 931.73]|eukprot:ORY02977.1 hypothetical protein K493DRAFT_311865 [Basidiobolus meristosporus CBS 931.73]